MNTQPSFSTIFKGVAVIVGVGNPLRGDDGIGSALVANLKDKINVVCIDTGNAPENFTGTIKQLNPDSILIIDAVDLGLDPGNYKFISVDELAVSGFSTHSYSLHLFVDYLRSETCADIYILGIQPGTTDFNVPLSRELEQTLSELTRLILNSSPHS